MKKMLFGAFVALGLAVTAAPVQAGWCIDYSVCRHLNVTFTGRTRCLNYTSCSNPLPGCAPGGYAGPHLWDSMAAYGAYPAPAAYPAPVAVAPAATPAPATPSPSFKAPQPTPATKSNGLQQAVYYYGQPASTGYNYNAGYGYGAGYSYYGYGSGYSYAQVPNYWY